MNGQGRAHGELLVDGRQTEGAPRHHRFDLAKVGGVDHCGDLETAAGILAIQELDPLVGPVGEADDHQVGPGNLRRRIQGFGHPRADGRRAGVIGRLPRFACGISIMLRVQ